MILTGTRSGYFSLIEEDSAFRCSVGTKYITLRCSFVLNVVIYLITAERQNKRYGKFKAWLTQQLCTHCGQS